MGEWEYYICNTFVESICITRKKLYRKQRKEK